MQEGKPLVLHVVHKVEQQLVNDPKQDKEYLVGFLYRGGAMISSSILGVVQVMWWALQEREHGFGAFSFPWVFVCCRKG